MRNFYLGFVLCLAVLLSGCAKDDFAVNNAKVTVSGTSYSFSNMLFVSSGGDDYSITNQDNNSGMDITINLYQKKVGSYDLSSWDNVVFYIGDDRYESVSGNLTTTIFTSSRIEGSFEGVFKKNGKVTDQYRVSGSFVATYSVPK